MVKNIIIKMHFCIQMQVMCQSAQCNKAITL